MLIELLSVSNYISFNSKLAQILGLHPAIYLSQIMDINEKAIRKEKVDGNFFTIDREYIQKRTTLDEKEQIEIENTLLKLGILERSEDNAATISLSITTLTSIMMSPDEDLLKDISNISKPKKTKTKAEKIAENLKGSITAINTELRQAYFNWIDTVLEKDGFMTKQAVVSGQMMVDQASNRNLDVALKIIEIGTINAWRDLKWAVNAYNKDYKVNYTFADPIPVPNSTPSATVRRARLSDETF